MDIFLSSILEEVDYLLEFLKDDPIYNLLVTYRKEGEKAFHNSDHDLMEKLVNGWHMIDYVEIGNRKIWSTWGYLGEYTPIMEKIDNMTILYDRKGNEIQRYWISGD